MVITDLILLPTFASSELVEICQGETYFAAGAEQSTSGMYIDTLISSEGCDSLVTTELLVNVCLLVYNIPNAFTPNGDGINDVFRVTGKDLTSYELYVYNRWGEEVYSGDSTAGATGWDGTYNGELLDLGVYVYYAKVILSDGSEIMPKGNITLLR